MPLTAREIIKKIEANGWRFLQQTGGHRIFVHHAIRKIIIVPIHKGDLKIGSERQILRDAGLL